MNDNIVWGTEFRSKTKPSAELTELANKIFAEALDVGGPDLWAEKHSDDGKQPA